MIIHKVAKIPKSEYHNFLFLNYGNIFIIWKKGEYMIRGVWGG